MFNTQHIAVNNLLHFSSAFITEVMRSESALLLYYLELPELPSYHLSCKMYMRFMIAGHLYFQLTFPLFVLLAVI